MRLLFLLLLALPVAGCGDGADASSRSAAPAVTAAPDEDPLDDVDDALRAQVAWLARELDLDASGRERVEVALRRAWDDVEREAAALALGQRPLAGESLEEAIAALLEARQGALDEELAAGLDPARRARFAALCGRVALEGGDE